MVRAPLSILAVRKWDLRQVLDVYRRTYFDNDRDWFHMNALYYDESDDALIISGRNQSAVVKVTMANELVWILAPHKGWGLAGVDATGHNTAEFLLTAVAASGVPYPEPVQLGDEDAPGFAWAWGQHASTTLPNGNLFLFDNGLTRNFTPDDEGDVIFEAVLHLKNQRAGGAATWGGFDIVYRSERLSPYPH